VNELCERDFGSFFAAPFDSYRDDPAYTSPMRSDLVRFLDGRKNPLFKEHGDFTYFSVRRNGRSLGRIVAHVHDDSNKRHGLRRGYFGFFDCVDDAEVAGELLGAAAEWARQRGCEELAGNFNLTAMQQIGVVTEGFGAPAYTDMQYNPAHIPRLLAECGFDPFFPMATHELELDGFDPERMRTPGVEAVLERDDLRWVPLRRRSFRRQLEDTRKVLNASFDQNPMFVPLTKEEFFFQAEEMMWIMDGRLSHLVYRDSEPVGVVVCIPDLNPLLRSVGSRLGPSFPLQYLKHLRNRRRAVIIFWAVHPSMWGQGLNPAMLHHVTTALKGAGYTRLGLTWIADENKASLRQVEKLGGRRLHRLHLFRKPL
jgi:RimJ/RimL family protein N-acetyltransferase